MYGHLAGKFSSSEGFFGNENTTLDRIQTELDVIGWIPGIGDVADGANGLISLYRKDYVSAGLDLVSMVPLIGDVIGKGGKTVKQIIKHSDDVIDTGKQIIKHSDDFIDFSSWLHKGDLNNKVYFGIIDGERKYTGITKQSLNVRLNQHLNKGKGFSNLIQVEDNLTRNQARAIEQYFIENGPNDLNKINSISPKNKYYNDAMAWAKQYLGE